MTKHRVVTMSHTPFTFHTSMLMYPKFYYFASYWSNSFPKRPISFSFIFFPCFLFCVIIFIFHYHTVSVSFFFSIRFKIILSVYFERSVFRKIRPNISATDFLSLICFFQYTAQRFSNIPLKYSTFKFTLPLL